MELLTAINERHSIRSFEEKKVPEELLLKLADAAQKAPSASNLQAWRFLFVTDEEKREKVDFFSPGLSGRPPVILVICSDMAKALKRGGENAKKYGCMMDAAMAAENLMLAAREYGLGGTRRGPRHLRHQVLQRDGSAQDPGDPGGLPD